MFPAGERGHTETEWFRSYHAFNFGEHQNEHKVPWGPLYVLNDDTLAGGKSVQLSVEENSVIVLLPVVGAVKYADSIGNEAVLEASQINILHVRKGTSVTLSNDYEEELINYLQIWLKSPTGKEIESGLFSFDIDYNRNQLTDLLASGQRALNSPSNLKLYIGKFSGRMETVYKLCDSRKGVFVFVLQGAFEVQYRLLEARDGLALWDVDEIELEALSNDAIILLMEISLEQ